MLHGCQKKIYHIRNVGSRFFDEVYFVLRDGYANDTRMPAKDLAAEADRIIRDAAAEIRRKRSRVPAGVKTAAVFVLGALSAALLIGIVAVVFTGS